MELNDIYQPMNKDEMDKCPNCYRLFMQGRLLLHSKSCKYNKPLKMLNVKTQSNSNQKIKLLKSSEKKNKIIHNENNE